MTTNDTQGALHAALMELYKQVKAANEETDLNPVFGCEVDAITRVLHGDLFAPAAPSPKHWQSTDDGVVSRVEPATPTQANGGDIQVRRDVQTILDYVHSCNRNQVPIRFEPGSVIDAMLKRLGERISGGASPQQASIAQAEGVAWDKFPGWLIDHHEGETLTEEMLQHALADMLKQFPARQSGEAEDARDSEAHRAAVRTLEQKGYTFHGGTIWRPPLGLPPLWTIHDSQGARDVLAERFRQVAVEGWNPAHDDEHTSGDMAEAAVAYAQEASMPCGGLPMGWPWAKEWWKPTTPRRNLVKAGALIIAEIERIDRAAKAAETAPDTEIETLFEGVRRIRS